MPAIASGSSTVTFEFAFTTVAVGFSSRDRLLERATCSGVAESILLITTTSALRRFASPGWYRVSWPARSGSTRVRWTVGTVERQVVVAAVPQQDVAFGLRLLEDRGVVDAGVDHRAGRDVRLVLLALLDRHVGVVEVLELAKRWTRCATRSP